MLQGRSLSLICATALTLAISSAVMAGGYAPEQMPAATSNSGYTLGLNYATYGGNDFALMAGYINDYFLADIGAGYEDLKVNATNTSSHIFELRGDLGLRYSLMHTLFLTGGALGSYGFRSPENTATRVEPYAIGAFVGLDYQPISELLLSFKLSPYTYMRIYTKNEHNNVFADGSIAASYVFAA